jgi:hypothetical protein
MCPTGNYPHYSIFLQLKDDLKPPAGPSGSYQLIAISKRLVPANLKVRKEAFNGFLKTHTMMCELISIKIVFEISGDEPTPISHVVILYESWLPSTKSVLLTVNPLT